MCIAILKKSGTRQITDEEFTNCWNKNPDGFGAIYQQKIGRKMTVDTYKTLDKEEARAFFHILQGREDVFDIAFHFRIGTSGYLDLTNCHPFDVGQGYYMIHNGILKLNDPFGERSDTNILAEILRNTHEKWYLDESKLKDLGTFATGSKLVFVSPKHSFIVNEKAGHYDEGVWFSNYSYETYKAPPAPVYPKPVVSGNNLTPYQQQQLDDYYSAKGYDYRKEGKKYKNNPSAKRLEILSKTVHDKVNDWQEFGKYKSAMQGYLSTREEKITLNCMTIKEHNDMWTEYMDMDDVPYKDRLENMEGFVEFVMDWYERLRSLEVQIGSYS